MVVQRGGGGGGGGGSDMFSCRVLYIGSAPPLETMEGVEAMQEPLNLRYPADLTSVEGIDCSVTVHPDRLSVRYMESGQVVEYPLERLKICAAVRAVGIVEAGSGQSRRRFVPVNQIECDKDHPAIFAAILRRSQGRQIQECHSFICNSPRDALHLVNATATANMALKKGVNHRVDRTVMVHQQNGGYQSDTSRREQLVTSQRHEGNDVIYIRSTTEEAPPRIEPQPAAIDMEPLDFKLRTPDQNISKSNDVIYVGFDKSNLIQKDEADDNFEVRTPGARGYDIQTSNRIVMNGPPSPRPPPPPMMVQARPQPMMVQARPMLVQGPPRMAQRQVIYGPPPRPPPQPMLVRPAMAPRMYQQRRVMSPPPQRVVVQKGYTQSRARSSSPIRYARSDARYDDDRFHPRWRSHNSEIAGSRPYRERAMYPSERAFSHRVNGDSRISRSGMGYYQGGGHNTYYDRPVTKSNPKYSSSESSSDDGRDNRFDRSRLSRR